MKPVLRLKETLLSGQTGDDVEHYLNAKGRLPELKAWQFRQIADALRLLFTDLVQAEWSKSYDSPGLITPV